MDVSFIGPAEGSLVCGEEGRGRLAEVSDIIEAAISELTTKDLKGRKVLVTAGPTLEPFDPVRYISNRSSGKMGYAIARAALRRGAEVILISGPSSEIPAADMEKAVFKYLPKADTIIMTAAVADFSPSTSSKVKLEKNGVTSLNLKKNNDILKMVGKKKGRKTLIGFAAETGNNIDRAMTKLKEKNLDMIVMNDVTQKGAGFNVDTNIITIINKNGRTAEYPLMQKINVANVILDEII